MSNALSWLYDLRLIFFPGWIGFQDVGQSAGHGKESHSVFADRIAYHLKADVLVKGLLNGNSRNHQHLQTALFQFGKEEGCQWAQIMPAQRSPSQAIR